MDVSFRSFELNKFGKQWRSAGEVSVVPGSYRYYLEFGLDSGDHFKLGAPDKSFSGKAIEHFETLQFSALTNPWPLKSKQEEDKLIPDWGWWAIAGGVVIIVATGVAIGMSASNEAP